jgi:hypothetical protein
MLRAFSQCLSATNNGLTRFCNASGVFSMFLGLFAWENLQNIEKTPHLRRTLSQAQENLPAARARPLWIEGRPSGKGIQLRNAATLEVVAVASHEREGVKLGRCRDQHVRLAAGLPACL